MRWAETPSRIDNLFIDEREETHGGASLDGLSRELAHGRPLVLKRTHFELLSPLAALWNVLVGAAVGGVMLSPLVIVPALLVAWWMPQVPAWWMAATVAVIFLTGAAVMLRRHRPLREFRARRALVHSRDLVLDFGAQALVAAETYDHVPERTRRHEVPLRELRLAVSFHEAPPDNDVGDVDAFVVHLVVANRKKLGFGWAQRHLERSWVEAPVHRDDQKAEVEARVLALVRRFDAHVVR